MKMPPIVTFLWFDTQAEEAANFYTSIFSNSRIGAISRYGKQAAEMGGQKPGSVMTVSFQLGDYQYVALNGGPMFKFTEAISIQLLCDTQEEIDYFWDKLSADGDPKSQVCGWLKDKYGLSWQVTPTVLSTLLSDPERAVRVTKAFMQMKKMDIDQLLKA